MLLTWTVSNFGSFYEESTIDCQKRTFHRNRPKDDDWNAVTQRAIAIFGANGSGKTTILDALSKLGSAVRNSTGDDRYVKALRFPHALHSADPTSFEADYVANNVRYSWSVELDDQGIVKETLKCSPNGYWRSIYVRDRGDITFGPKCGIARAAQETISDASLPWVLTLSAWSRTRSPGVHYVASEWWHFCHSLSVLDKTDAHRGFFTVLQSPQWGPVIRAILEASDVGISDVAVKEKTAPPELRKTIAQINRLLRDMDSDAEDEEVGDLSEEEKEIIFRNMVFTHASDDGEFHLSEAEESMGTRVWFDLAMSAMLTIVIGGLLIVDELDQSLHPELVARLVSWFMDSSVNSSGAQLLFTTHDVSLMGRNTDSGLQKENFWLAEKVASKSQLIALDEFHIAKNHNLERRYLQGAYGALPILPDMTELKDRINQLRDDLFESNQGEEESVNG